MMTARKVILIILLLNFYVKAFTQKPKDGTYLLKYFDVEYNKFNGTCKMIINGDSAIVYSVKDCHRNPGTMIEKGILKKNDSGKWTIDVKKEDVPSTIDFKKKIFYTL